MQRAVLSPCDEHAVCFILLIRELDMDAIDRKFFESGKLLEATLELGRNWAIPLAVIAFCTANWHKEIALETWLTREIVLYAGLVFSIFWMGVGILRFLDVAQVSVKSKVQTAFAMALIFAMVAVGAGLIIAVGRFADNANAVNKCSTYAYRFNHPIHNNPICQRLYEKRAESTRPDNNPKISNDQTRHR